MSLPAPAVYWNLNENTGTVIADSAVGGANPATLTNGVWVTGKFGAGIRNASSASAAATFAPVNMGRTFTVSLWIKDWDGVDDGVVLGSGQGQYAAYLDATDWYFSAGNFVSVPHGGGLSDGRWHQLTLVRDDDLIYFYKDAVLLAGSPQTGSFAESIYSALLAYEDTEFAFIGSVDEVRMYYSAFSAGQVAELFHLTLGDPIHLAADASVSANIAGAPVQRHQAALKSWRDGLPTRGLQGPDDSTENDDVLFVSTGLFPGPLVLTTSILLAASVVVAAGAEASQFRTPDQATFQADLVGYSLASAALLTAISLQGSAALSASATLAVKDMRLAAAVLAALTSSAPLTTRIPLAASVALTADMQGDTLQTSILLAAAAIARISPPFALLSTRIPMSGQADIRAAINAALTTSIPLASIVQGHAVIAAQLTTAIEMVATVPVSATVRAKLKNLFRPGHGSLYRSFIAPTYDRTFIIPRDPRWFVVAPSDSRRLAA